MSSPEQEERNRIFGSIEREVCYCLANINYAFQEKAFDAPFLNDDEVLDSFRRIYEAIGFARNSHIPETEIITLLDNYKNRGLYHLVNSICSLRQDEASSIQYFDASLQFAIVVEIPPIEIARVWLSATSFDKREEIFSILPSNLRLNESDLKVLESEFFPNSSNNENVHLERFVTAAFNSLKRKFELVLKAEETEDEKFLPLLADFFEWQKILEKEFNLTPERKQALLGPYQEEALDILAKRLRKYYLNFQEKEGLADKENQDSLRECVLINRLTGISDKKSILQLLARLSDFEKKDKVSIVVLAGIIFEMDRDSQSQLINEAEVEKLL